MTLLKTYMALLGFVASACARVHEGRAAINAKVSPDIPAGGTAIGRQLANVESFNAIPYADPPVSPLRFKPPRKLSTQPGIIDGTVIAPACPQMPISSDIEDVTSKLPAEFRKLPFYSP
ncbi:Carboxylesterase, type B [Cordyceps fumosorosea ARSEF 2679]|uniref:Carboxylesterase, type B n=1 Tax=Cordyceps fumosorosea (strain ARSEF 2679) TaxID=1081104 RepID=A0A167LQX2_CORFA|nr:Carboxylesterase, type B [Cordyceps fumosorosea ARSEF 2679]OAA53389.1 Carboxylesterase, type B [Cordyceps fumosorosea ARSEF 2679]